MIPPKMLHDENKKIHPLKKGRMLYPRYHPDSRTERALVAYKHTRFL